MDITAEKYFADAVERKKNKYRRLFSATYPLLPLALSTCGEVRSDVRTLIKELAIRQVEHRSETHLAEEAEAARFHVFGGDSLLFYSRHFHFARVIISADRGWRLRAPDSSVRKALCLYMRFYLEGNRVRGTGRSERGRGRDRSREWERRRERGRGRKRRRER